MRSVHNNDGFLESDEGKVSLPLRNCVVRDRKLGQRVLHAVCSCREEHAVMNKACLSTENLE
ncbi:hypothetical protein SCLCIDRAFT_1216904 [Scleroderma citrinum Foug A]|uniref:Uncharacterized protein n=1 Tax=Scleroderma citrinum Foug A TaxID=1036808 RepID=A0A0C3A6C0_9AGAM|nr:hypothetical protein SCLCIDRAFT_1216904 [Scleroderma citrinum Foug A]